MEYCKWTYEFPHYCPDNCPPHRLPGKVSLRGGSPRPAQCEVCDRILHRCSPECEREWHDSTVDPLAHPEKRKKSKQRLRPVRPAPLLHVIHGFGYGSLVDVNYAVANLRDGGRIGDAKDTPAEVRAALAEAGAVYGQVCWPGTRRQSAPGFPPSIPSPEGGAVS